MVAKEKSKFKHKQPFKDKVKIKPREISPTSLLYNAIKSIQTLDVPLYRKQAESILGRYSTIRLNHKDKKGATLLHLAVRTGSLALVKTLIKAGAEVNAQDVI